MVLQTDCLAPFAQADLSGCIFQTRFHFQFCHDGIAKKPGIRQLENNESSFSSIAFFSGFLNVIWCI